MRVCAYDPHLSPEVIRERGAELMSVHDLLAQSEFLTLHLPLNASIRHLIDANGLWHVKSGAYLINVARGGLVNTQALPEAMRDGRIRGAALDVFEGEPPSAENPFLELDNPIFTPHSAALTEEAMLRMGLDSSEDVLRGERPLNCANAEDLRTRIAARES